jgi:hypothetical protein
MNEPPTWEYRYKFVTNGWSRNNYLSKNWFLPAGSSLKRIVSVMMIAVRRSMVFGADYWSSRVSPLLVDNTASKQPKKNGGDARCRLLAFALDAYDYYFFATYLLL